MEVSQVRNARFLYQNHSKLTVINLKLEEAGIEVTKELTVQAAIKLVDDLSEAIADIADNGMTRDGKRVKQLEAFKQYFSDLFGEGLEVANWHQNGETEPFDSFYDSAVSEELTA